LAFLFLFSVFFHAFSRNQICFIGQKEEL